MRVRGPGQKLRAAALPVHHTYEGWLNACRDFLVTKMEGLLELTVKSASNLPVADVSSKNAIGACRSCVVVYSLVLGTP